MRILSVDTSSNVATVALCEDDKLICEIMQNTKLTHSQTLMPMVDEVLKKGEVNIEDIDLFATAIGPGSFTGLRIGIAAVKGFAQALNKKTCGISTLEAMAYNLSFSKYKVCPIMDARRSQVYNAVYSFDEGEIKEEILPRALALDELLSEIKEKGEKVVFCGDAVRVYKDEIIEKIGELALFAPISNLEQRASSIGALAYIKVKNGEEVSPFELEPVYLRKCQAEREAEEREKLERGEK